MKTKRFETEHFQETFENWGKFDRKRRHSNTWHNPDIPIPKGYDYASLTEGLHPDQDAYRRWCLDVMTHLIFLKAETNKVVRFLELGCADAHEVTKFLSDYEEAWEAEIPLLEVHMLDDDAVRLKEAQNQLDPLNGKKVRIFLWHGRLEDLTKPQSPYELFYSKHSDEKSSPAELPEDFDLIFSQLILHHYSLFELFEIFKNIYKKTAGAGYFLFSDICYTGIDSHDAIIWNRVLLQIERMRDQKKRDFWLNHYKADYKTYHERHEILHALEIAGFQDVDILQRMYDMILVLAQKKS